MSSESNVKAYSKWRGQFEKGVVGIYDALLTLTQAQTAFITLPSGVNWARVDEAMYIYQQALWDSSKLVTFGNPREHH